MDGYADSLGGALHNSSKFEVDHFLPSSPLERFSKNQNVMRFLRYVQYPLAVKSQTADIHHIIDHGYAHLLPRISSGKKCVTVHDLIPLLSWNGTIEVKNGTTNKKKKFRKPYLNSYSNKYLSGYDQIIASSQSTRNDLVNFLHLDERNISVVSPIISSCFGHVDAKRVDDFRVRYSLHQSSKWLMISGGGYYKNHDSCLQVLQALNQQSDVPISLIRTGIVSDEFDQKVKAMGLTKYVRNLYLPKTTDLPDLYAAVDCLLFPSLYEGFGMPVAEALACGTPVVTSNRGSLKEVAGELAPQINPYDIEMLTRAVYRALFEPSIKQMTFNNGQEWVEQYRDKQIIKKIENVYSELIQ